MKTQIMKFKFFFLFIFLLYFSVYKVESTEKWDIFELTLKGPSTGNPFTEVELSATFTNGSEKEKIKGFYDGDGVYKIRFMPSKEGIWNYKTRSNIVL